MKWIRKVTLRANGAVINPGGMQQHEIKIGFSVSKSISGSANTASIDIWNLAEGTRNALGKELTEVTLEAGHIFAGDIGVIFKGQIRDIEHERQGVDIVTHLDCGDGDKAYRRAVISKTYPKGTPVKDVVEGVYGELAKEGIAKGEWKFPDDIEDFKRPYSMCGACNRELDVLGRGKGFYWSLQNETMEVIPSDGFLSGSAVVISPETGMIDTPTVTDNGIKVSTLLNPQIRPGRLVQVKAQTLDMNGESGGLYRVSQATYSGTNRDGTFQVAVHGETVSGGKVDEGVKP